MPAPVVLETSAEWIAFVDDDNLLADDWLHEMADAIARFPTAGGFGGRVVLEWSEPPPSYMRGLGWCFAEQDRGAEIKELDNLVGAGMVLRRTALLAGGWPNHLLIQDRVGAKLISGGDVEMVQRVRLAGNRLWYVPDCVLKHVISPARAERRHVVGLAFGLGAGAARVSAVCFAGHWKAWRPQAQAELRKHADYALYLSRQALSGGTTWTAALVQARSPPVIFPQFETWLAQRRRSNRTSSARPRAF